MTYIELIEKAKNGRSVHATAQALEIPVTTFQRYASGQRLPDYESAVKLAIAAGLEPGEVLEMLAAWQRIINAQRQQSNPSE